MHFGQLPYRQDISRRESIKIGVNLEHIINMPRFRSMYLQSAVPEDHRMEFRVGINLGDVIEEEERIYGDGVNISARIEGLAAGGGIAISGTVYEHIKDKMPLGYHYLGEQNVKNIPEPVRVYRLLTEPEEAGMMIGEKRPKRWKMAHRSPWCIWGNHLIGRGTHHLELLSASDN